MLHDQDCSTSRFGTYYLPAGCFRVIYYVDNFLNNDSIIHIKINNFKRETSFQVLRYSVLFLRFEVFFCTFRFDSDMGP